MSDLDRKRISAVEMMEKHGFHWTDGAWRPPSVLCGSEAAAGRRILQRSNRISVGKDK